MLKPISCFKGPARFFSRTIVRFNVDDVEESDYRNRKKLVYSDVSTNYYPPLGQLSTDYDSKLRVPKFINEFQHINFTEFPNKRYPKLVNIQGKIVSIRRNGKYMYFIDLEQDFSKVQIIVNNKMCGLTKEEFVNHYAIFKKGDYINCVGNPSTSNTGELSLKLTEKITMLSPCLNSMIIPENISDKKIINSNRVLNYLASPLAKERIIIKNLIIKLIRQFFVSKDFMEFQTPLINGNATGANAKPFITQSNHVDSELQLRVAPELWLKKLVISGFEKIFEIGPSFRNEGIDATHNPEFTSCEFYQTFTDLSELMSISQQLFRYIYENLEAEASKSDIKLLQSTLPALKPLTQEFQKVEFIPTIESKANLKLPQHLTSSNLIEYHKALNLPIPEIKSPAILLDNLASIFLETISETTTTPVFIYNHPSELSPLSKSTDMKYDDRTYNISLRFELFIRGKEYINAYEEENSPADQLAKFKLQQASKDQHNDQEALIPDWNYIKSLEYGLPPTGGWGCGIDRLAMLFSNSERIDQVLPFGNLRDVLKN